MFCNNPDCNHTTCAESFDFLKFKAEKTKRLENEIINISMNVSSLTAIDLLNLFTQNFPHSRSPLYTHNFAFPFFNGFTIFTLNFSIIVKLSKCTLFKKKYYFAEFVIYFTK